MTRFVFSVVLLSGAFTALAQQGASPVDLASAIKNAYQQNEGFILASADKWPNDAWNWKPAGPDKELREFGQLLVHIANENNQQCSRALGRATPPTKDDTGTSYTKADATNIVKDSFKFCDPVFQALTNENMAEMVKIPGRGNSSTQRARATSLILDLAHSNEQYGQIMIYFGLKGMVPVSHAK